MIAIKNDEVKPIDVGKMLKIRAMEGVTIQWLIHKGVGDDRYGHRFAMRLYTVPPGKAFPMHFHKYVEAFFILSGRVEFESEKESCELGPGDVVTTYADEPHGGTVLGNEPAKVLCCIECIDESTCDPQKQAQVIKTK